MKNNGFDCFLICIFSLFMGYFIADCIQENGENSKKEQKQLIINETHNDPIIIKIIPKNESNHIHILLESGDKVKEP